MIGHEYNEWYQITAALNRRKSNNNVQEAGNSFSFLEWIYYWNSRRPYPGGSIWHSLFFRPSENGLFEKPISRKKSEVFKKRLLFKTGCRTRTKTNTYNRRTQFLLLKPNSHWTTHTNTLAHACAFTYKQAEYSIYEGIDPKSVWICQGFLFLFL